MKRRSCTTARMRRAIVGFEMEQMILPLLKGPHVPRFVASRRFLEAAIHRHGIRAGQSCCVRMLDDARAGGRDGRRCRRAWRSALDALHRQHVIHLDIKPSNIILRPTGEAVLIDFGLSHHEMLPDLLAEEFRLPDGNRSVHLARAGPGIRTDPRSDIFSLGVLLYHLATGERPFGYPRTKAR